MASDKSKQHPVRDVTTAIVGDRRSSEPEFLLSMASIDETEPIAQPKAGDGRP